MKIDLILVTNDQDIVEYVKLKKSVTIPRDIRNKELLRDSVLYVTSYSTKSTKTEDDFQVFIGKIMNSCDAVLVLCDKSLFHLFTPYADCVMLAGFDGELEGGTLHNYIGRALARLFNIFQYLDKYFDDQKYLNILLLPLRNFLAEELCELRKAFHEDILSADFRATFEKSIAALRERRGPKPYSRYNYVYLRDDADHFFSDGPERHAKVQTGSPPHSVYCGLNSQFRFGRRYDSARHFNVSKERKDSLISGRFSDCHDEKQDVKPRSHLNIFPNDFIS